mgnify:CR=1 FL=1
MLFRSLGQTFDGSVTVRTRAGDIHQIKADLAHANRQKLVEKFLAIASPSMGDSNAKAAADEILGGNDSPWKPATRFIAQVPLVFQ